MALRRLWLHDKQAFSYLAPHQQWQLHDFFQPAKDLTKDQLLQHRQTITAQQPSLPHQAGRAMRALRAGLRVRTTSPAITGIKHGRSTHIQARAIVMPDIDEAKLAQAFLLLAKRQD